MSFCALFLPYLPVCSARFEMDYILAALKKPYIAVMDGMTSMSINGALYIQQGPNFILQWVAASV